MDFWNLLESGKANFTKTDLKIYESIMSNPEQLERCTVAQLASRIGVSGSAIIRFCARLGYSGYSEFRYAYIRDARTSLDGSQGSTVVSSVVSAHCEAISAVSSVGEENLLCLAEAISRHHFIKAYGIGKSLVPGRMLRYNLIRFSKLVDIQEDVVILNDYEKALRPQDLLIVFTVNGDSGRILDLARAAREVGCETFVITCNDQAPILAYDHNNIVISCQRRGESYLLSCHAAMIALVDVVTSLYVRNYLGNEV